MHRWTPRARLAAAFCSLALAAGCASGGPAQRRTNEPLRLSPPNAVDRLSAGSEAPSAPPADGGPSGNPSSPTPSVPPAGPEPSAEPPVTGAPASPSEVGALVANAERCAQVRARARSNPPLYSDTSIFNTPASCLDLHPESAGWAERWFNFANLPGRTDPTRRGELDIAFDAYSTPIYDAAEATTTMRVFHPNWAWQSDLGPTGTVPWNPAWKPAPGNDAEMTIVDSVTGKEWALWGVMTSNKTGCWTVENLLHGYRDDTALCVWTAFLERNADGTLADGRRGDGYSLKGGRGMGQLLSRALLPTLDEIENGSINHAVNMETYATMFGPACTAVDVSAGRAGTECGFAVSPATRLEYPDGPGACGASTQPNTVEGRSKSVPEGMRFVLNKTDAEIEAWLDSRSYVGAKRDTARIFAVALRDYGWIISDTTCWTSSMAVEGVANPSARARWRNLGITDPSGDGALLRGLIGSADDVLVLKPNTDRLFTTVHGS